MIFTRSYRIWIVFLERYKNTNNDKYKQEYLKYIYQLINFLKNLQLNIIILYIGNVRIIKNPNMLI